MNVDSGTVEAAVPGPRRQASIWEKFDVLLVRTVVGLVILLFLGAMLALIFSKPIAHALPGDALLVFLGIFGYVTVEILAAFSRWMRSETRVEGKDDAHPAPREKPEDYAPGVPPKMIFHGKE